MPPRYSYWTILAGGLPTAFRAAEREDLLPTFNRIRDKHPDAEMKWFARGQLWASPEAAQEDLERVRMRRDRDWRPGGAHRDPRKRLKEAPRGGDKSREDRPQRPKDPRPKDPRPKDSPLTGPSPTRPRPTGPRPAGSRPAGPRPTGPRPTGPRPTGSRPTGPRPAAPRPAAPRPPGPRPSRPRGDGPPRKRQR
jgi:hypothetical protein